MIWSPREGWPTPAEIENWRWWYLSCVGYKREAFAQVSIEHVGEDCDRFCAIHFGAREGYPRYVIDQALEPIVMVQPCHDDGSPASWDEVAREIEGGEEKP